MKLFKKTLIILGTLVTLFTLFSLLAVNAQAALPDYDGTSGLIYYFNDYYPSIPEDALENSYPTYTIFYDHEWVDSQSFASVTSRFFELDSDCLLIIDIKTFIPNATSLLTLFSNLKDSCDCTIVFISAYDLGAFSNDDFRAYIDLFICIQFGRLQTFINNSTDFMFPEFANPDYPEDGEVGNKAILIDGNLINHAELHNVNYLNSVISDSVFMTFMLEELADLIPYTLTTNSTGSTDYALFLSYLKATYNINFFIHIGEDSYMNLLNLETIEATELDDLHNGETTYEWDHIYAVVFLHSDPNLYNFLYQEQESFNTIFAMVCDTVEYGEGGLTCVTDGGAYDMTPFEAAVLAAIQEIF